MSDGSEPTIWIIDEDETELKLHQNIIQRAISDLGAEILVQAVPARYSMGDYHDILRDTKTVAIVIDQRLNETRGTDHTGIELAMRLRSLTPKLPIYILTNYAQSDDFLGSEWSVEDILSKDAMHEEDQLKIFIARLLRRIDVHQSITEAHETRFRELLKKSLAEDLDEKEQKELEELQFNRTAIIASDEVSKLQKLEEGIRKLKELNARFSDDE